MKKDLHPTDYRPVVFQDTGADFAFLTRSTAKSAETIKWTDGKEYPLIKIHISSASHPFYTGEEKIVDVEGRVDRFKAKQAAAKDRATHATNKAKKAAKKAESRTVSNRPVQKIGAAQTKKAAPKPKAEKPAEKPAEAAADK